MRAQAARRSLFPCLLSAASACLTLSRVTATRTLLVFILVRGWNYSADAPAADGEKSDAPAPAPEAAPAPEVADDEDEDDAPAEPPVEEEEQWDIYKLSCVDGPHVNHNGVILGACTNPEGNRYCSAGGDGKVTVSSVGKSFIHKVVLISLTSIRFTILCRCGMQRASLSRVSLRAILMQ